MTVKSRIPSYRLHKPTGQAVVTFNGKDHYLGRHGTAPSKEKYTRLLQEWISRGEQVPPEPGHTGSLSINELILAYRRHAGDYYAQSPKEVEKIALALRPLRVLYGRSLVADFGPLALKSVRSKMLDVQHRTFRQRVVENDEEVIKERTVEYKLTRRTINMRIDIIKRTFRWGTENELVPAGIYQALQTVAGLRKGRSDARETRRVKPVANEEVEKVLPLVNRYLRAMIELHRLTGSRSGEICLMRECDIDMSRPIWIYRPSRHKNDHRDQERLIYLGPKAQEILKQFFTSSRSSFLFSPKKATEERYKALRAARKSKVQLSQVSRKKSCPKKRPGDRYSVYSYRRAIHNACRKAGIPPWHPHQLRHAAATMLRREFGVELARIILGHSTAFTTEIYAEVDRNKAMDAMGKIG